MTISSQMLSLTGSLLPLPFSIPAFPNNPLPTSSATSSKSNSDALPLADANVEGEAEDAEASLRRAERKKAKKLEKEALKRKREEAEVVEVISVEGSKKKKVKKVKV